MKLNVDTISNHFKYNLIILICFVSVPGHSPKCVVQRRHADRWHPAPDRHGAHYRNVPRPGQERNPQSRKWAGLHRQQVGEGMLLGDGNPGFVTKTTLSCRHDSHSASCVSTGGIGGGYDAWWRHQMEAFSALLALCAGNSPVTGEFPSQSPVTQSFDAFFNLRLNKRLSKQSLGWWFKTPSRSLWRHCNGYSVSEDRCFGVFMNFGKN